LPRQLLALPFHELLEFERCRGELATILRSWNLGETRAIPAVGGKDPVERIRRLLLNCPDELPRPEPELPFITDNDFRLDTEPKVHAAWTDFKASEWLGATVFAGCALEAILLWEVKRGHAVSPVAADKLHLADLIKKARAIGSISQQAAVAKLARDGRDLLHPGRKARLGLECSKATALTALAAVQQVAEERSRAFKARSGNLPSSPEERSN